MEGRVAMIGSPMLKFDTNPCASANGWQSAVVVSANAARESFRELTTSPNASA